MNKLNLIITENKTQIRRQEDKRQIGRKYLQAVYRPNDSCLEYMKNCLNLMVRKQPKQTMGNRSEWTLHQRGLKDDKYTQGNTFNIISD